MRSTITSVLAILLCATFIAVPANALVMQRGSDTTIDIATWNLRQFPQEGVITTTVVSLMVADLELDVIGVQEIQDENAFEQVASNAGGWSALYSQAYAGDLRFGVLYDNSKVTVTGSPFNVPGNAFVRNPYAVPMEVTENGVTLEFVFVVLHLKAYDTPDDRDTRRAEILALKTYLDAQLQQGDQTHWVVVGDYNDELDDPDDLNVFTPLLDDDDYTFLTLPIAGSNYYASYINSLSLIDHLMVTEPMMPFYGDEGEVETLRLDTEYLQYQDIVSDHRPVAAYFPAIGDAVAEITPAALPNQPSLSLRPVPSNASVTVQYQLQSPNGMLSVYDLLGRMIWSSELKSTNGELTWPASNAASGLYLVRLTSPSGASATKRAVMVK